MVVPDSAYSVALAVVLLMEVHDWSYARALSRVLAFPGAPQLPGRFTSLVSIRSIHKLQVCMAVSMWQKQDPSDYLRAQYPFAGHTWHV